MRGRLGIPGSAGLARGHVPRLAGPLSRTVAALGLLWSLVLGSSAVSWDGRTQPYQVPTPSPTPGPPIPCNPQLHKSADPMTVGLGQNVRVELRVAADCAAAKKPVTVMHVIDQSREMSQANQLDRTKEGAKLFNAEVDFNTSRVGVVKYDTSQQVLQPMSERAPVDAYIDRISATGADTRDVARAMQRALPALGSEGARAMIVVASQVSTGGDVVREAQRAKNLGVIVAVITTRDADRQEYVDMATQGWYFHASSAGQIPEHYRTIASRLLAVSLKLASVTDVLGEQVELVPGSPSPAPEIQGKTLVWRFANIPRNGVSMRVEVQPREAGNIRTNQSATLQLTYSDDSTASLDFPLPVVNVVLATSTPTATSSPIAPSPTLDTGSPSATSTPQATQTPSPWGSIHLPFAAKGFRRATN